MSEHTCTYIFAVTAILLYAIHAADSEEYPVLFRRGKSVSYNYRIQFL